MSEDIPANAVPLSRLDAQRQLEKLQRAAHFIGVKLEVQLKSPRADPAHDGHSAWDITQHKGELAYLNALRLFIAHVRQHEALIGWSATQTKNVAGPYENARDGVLANVEQRATAMMALVRVHRHGGPNDGEVRVRPGNRSSQTLVEIEACGVQWKECVATWNRIDVNVAAVLTNTEVIKTDVQALQKTVDGLGEVQPKNWGAENRDAFAELIKGVLRSVLDERPGGCASSSEANSSSRQRQAERDEKHVSVSFTISSSIVSITILECFILECLIGLQMFLLPLAGASECRS